jgi:hypothetical protein
MTPTGTEYTVRKTGQTFGIFNRAGAQVEGGFFYRRTAEQCRRQWERAHARRGRYRCEDAPACGCCP